MVLCGLSFLFWENITWTGPALIHFLPNSLCSTQNQSIWFKTWTFTKTRQQWVLVSAACFLFFFFVSILCNIIGGGFGELRNRNSCFVKADKRFRETGHIWLQQISKNLKSPTEGAMYFLNCESRFAITPLPGSFMLSVQSIFVCILDTNQSR